MQRREEETVLPGPTDPGSTENQGGRESERTNRRVEGNWEEIDTVVPSTVEPPVTTPSFEQSILSCICLL